MATVTAFGAIWKVRDAAALAEYVREHASVLRGLLLFEIAHEGQATAAMAEAAALAGLSADFARWQRRLRECHPAR